ncbi:MAG TPA: nucleotide exchange factor GrpE [Pseudolabrys sp.]|nr:nucleotide exchange factor GrpE [Pseudolabrys sp.]
MTDDTAGKDTSATSDALGAPEPDMVPAGQVKAALEAAADFKDKLLRSLADMENLRRRTERDIADARQYGIAGFARDVLQVADNMHRALDHIGNEVRDSGDPKVKSLVEGVDLIERELTNVLEKHGVKMFTPLGEKFDPNLHQAMFETPATDEFANGTVSQVIQSGYMINERILRPAMVAVAKGSKGAAGRPAAANGNQTPDDAG